MNAGHRLSGAGGQYLFGVPILHGIPTDDLPHMRFAPQIRIDDGWRHYVRSVAHYHENCHLVQDVFTPFGAWHDLTRRSLDSALLKARSGEPEYAQATADSRQLIDSFATTYFLASFAKHGPLEIDLHAILEGDAALLTSQAAQKCILTRQWGDEDWEPYANLVKLDHLPSIYMTLARVTLIGLDIEFEDLVRPDDSNWSWHLTYWNANDMVRRLACDIALNAFAPEDLGVLKPQTRLAAVLTGILPILRGNTFGSLSEALCNGDWETEATIMAELSNFFGFPLRSRRRVFEQWVEHLTERGDLLSKYRADALEYRIHHPTDYLLKPPYQLIMDANLPSLLETREQPGIVTFGGDETYNEGLAKEAGRRMAEMCLVDTLIGAYPAICQRYPGCECIDDEPTSHGFPSASCDCVRVAEEFDIWDTEKDSKKVVEYRNEEVTMVDVNVEAALIASRKALETEKGQGFEFPGLVELLVVNVVLSVGVGLLTQGIVDWLKGDEKPMTKKEIDDTLSEMRQALSELSTVSEERLEKSRANTVNHLRKLGYPPQAASRIFESVKSALLES